MYYAGEKNKTRVYNTHGVVQHSTAPQYSTTHHSTAHYENAHSSMLMVPSPSLSATLTRRLISSSDSLSPRPRMISASSDGVTFATTTTTTTTTATATASHDKRAQKTPYFVYFHLVGTSRKNTNHATCTHKRRLTRDHARNLRIAGPSDIWVSRA